MAFFPVFCKSSSSGANGANGVRHRFGYILPDANWRDFDKLPDHIREGLTVHFAKRYQDVAAVVFGMPARG